MQALLHCPNVLVCVGREPFKPVSMENLRKHSVEKLPDLAPRSNGNNANENNESKKNSGAYCTITSRAVSHNMGITGTYCTAPTCRFHAQNVLPSLCLPGLSILPFFFSGFLLGFPPYTLQSFFYMLPMSGWLPFLFHISVSPFPSRTPSFPVSASKTPQTLEISHESSIPLSVWHIMPALLPLPASEDALFLSAGDSVSPAGRTCTVALWEQSMFLWKGYVQEGVCCGLFRMIFLRHFIMSYLRSQVISPATFG